MRGAANRNARAVGPRGLLRQHLARRQIVLAVGVTSSEQVVVGHAEQARPVPRKVTASIRIGPAVASHAVSVEHRLNDGDEIHPPIIGPGGRNGTSRPVAERPAAIARTQPEPCRAARGTRCNCALRRA